MESLLGDGGRLQPWWQGRSWRFWLTVLPPLLVMEGCGLFWVKAKMISAKFFTRLRDKMGGCKTPAGALTFFTNASTSGTRVQLPYRLACANGALEETMVYLVAGDGPRLVRYDARSPALLR